MSPWPFLIGAYAVTLIVIAIEIVAVRARHRAALRSRDEVAR